MMDSSTVSYDKILKVGAKHQEKIRSQENIRQINTVMVNAG